MSAQVNLRLAEPIRVYTKAAEPSSSLCWDACVPTIARLGSYLVTNPSAQAVLNEHCAVLRLLQPRISKTVWLLTRILLRCSNVSSLLRETHRAKTVRVRVSTSSVVVWGRATCSSLIENGHVVTMDAVGSSNNSLYDA